MEIDFNAARPIYEQVIEEIKKEIVRGEINPGEKLPSQRQMAKNIDVNPNTVQRAYREMDARDLVETKRGKGTFIKDDDKVITEIKKEMAEHAVENYIEQMESLGFNKEEIFKKLEDKIERRNFDE